MNKIIYTLYLYSRFRKLSDRYLVSGGLFFLFFHLLLAAFVKILCIQFNINFIDLLYTNRLTYIIIIFLGYFGFLWYAKFLIRRVRVKNLYIKKISIYKDWLFMAFSLLFFLFVMIFL